MSGYMYYGSNTSKLVHRREDVARADVCEGKPCLSHG